MLIYVSHSITFPSHSIIRSVEDVFWSLKVPTLVNDFSIPNYKEALKWYLMAAEQDLSSAQVNLGHMYKKGKGVKKNKTTAMYWFRKATKPMD